MKFAFILLSETKHLLVWRDCKTLKLHRPSEKDFEVWSEQTSKTKGLKLFLRDFIKMRLEFFSFHAIKAWVLDEEVSGTNVDERKCVY